MTNLFFQEKLILCVAIAIIYLAVYYILCYCLPLKPKKKIVRQNFSAQAREEYNVILHMLQLTITQKDVDDVEMKIVRFEHFYNNILDTKELHKMLKKLYDELYEKCAGTFSLS